MVKRRSLRSPYDPGTAREVGTEARDDTWALFIAMPLRHLESAAALGLERVVLPLGRPGDLPRAPEGSPVYCVTLDDNGIAAPAATWRGELVDWREPDPTDRPAAGLPPTWLAEREATSGPATDATSGTIVSEPVAAPSDDEGEGEEEDDDPDDDDEDDPDRSRQVFVTIEHLEALDRRDWIFANEVVRKQRRGARSFVPMTPTLVRLPD